MPDNYKMYFLVHWAVPIGLAMNSVAHAGVLATLQWDRDKDFNTWVDMSFRKVTCKVDDREFAEALSFPNLESIVVTESSLDGASTCIVFKPRKEWPKEFKKYRLYDVR